ncbi:ABC transporter permease [Streptomyces castrisilvae]|uniref:ABC transporter permease n=1 Tax=Streptomyces castrisilvae TaxID=3033811 RepID=A0ABY9HM81_9ACTN|nr:ABC transporter permease [Streptomyces sp. Mut1]WLQ35441.1 ABC transporter permease [Streptomyces sp. Mut1]
MSTETLTRRPAPGRDGKRPAGSGLRHSGALRRTVRILTPLAYAAAVLAAWSTYVRLADVPSYLLPAPGDVLDAGVKLVTDGTLWPNLSYTLRNIVLGFLGGSLIGIALGWVLWASRTVREILAPYMVLLQAAPKIAVAPLLVLWFGLSLTSQYALILLLVFFPMAMATMLGLKEVTADVSSLGRLLHLSRWQYLRKIQLPAAVPALLAGAKIAVIDAMTGAFLAEYLASERGLGYLMVLGNTSSDTPLLIAAVLITVAVGLLGFGLVSLAERKLLHWNR